MGSRQRWFYSKTGRCCNLLERRQISPKLYVKEHDFPWRIYVLMIDTMRVYISSKEEG